MKKTIIMFLVMVLFILLPYMGFAEISSNVDLTLSAHSGWTSTKIRTRDDASDYLLLSGAGRFAYTLTGKKGLVKGQTRLEILGNDYRGLLIDVSRAYIRTRVPLAESYAMQIELGKNALAWGEGNYYNAGDVIFGADPKTSDVGNVEYRDFAFWHLRTFFPINSFSYFEMIMGIPDQVYNTNTITGGILAPTPDITNAGAGARTHIETGILQWETGAYSRFMNQEIAPYISVALPLVVKLYIASGMDIYYDTDAKAFDEQRKKNFGVSGGALYILNIGNGGTMSLQSEALYKNNITKIQLNTTIFFNRVLGIIIRGDTAIENETYTFIIGPQWKPEAGFVLGMYAQSSLDINDDKDTNVVYVGTSLVMQYKY